MTPRAPLASPQIAEPVRALARAVRACLETGSPHVSIDSTLAGFAIGRHRVGPLLHAAVERGGAGLDTEAALRLRRHAERNSRRAAVAGLVQTRALHALWQAAIPSVVFKGLPMAQQLYADPGWRHFGDIDLLVRPEDFVEASRVLARTGASFAEPVITGDGTLARLSARFLRDVLMYDRMTGQKIELHQRLLIARTPNDAILACDASFRPRLPADKYDVPAPAVGAGLGLYLLQHGAISAWSRLKWLADVFALLPRLREHETAVLAGTAEDCGTAAAAKAGLILTRAVFGECLSAPLDAWSREQAGAASVNRRLAYYATMLNASSSTALNPTNARSEGLKSYLLLAEPLFQRIGIISRGSMAAGLRFTGRLFSGTAVAPARSVREESADVTHGRHSPGPLP